MFAHHLPILDEIESYVNRMKLRSIRIDGKVSHERRHQQVQQFQEDPNVKVAILSLTAAGVGLTLTATSNIIFAEVSREDKLPFLGLLS